MWKRIKNQRGFTLIELVVVIAILGVLAAVAVPMISNYLTGAKLRSFEADKERIQNAVDAFYGSPSNTRFVGKRQYPLIGRSGSATCATAAASCTTGTTTGTIADDLDPFGGSDELWNPVGGTVGASSTPLWTDAAPADGVRSTSTDTWARMAVNRSGTTYYTDPRYFFIDFDVLVTEGILNAIPSSAAPDNKPTSGTGPYTGSYIWYVDTNGRVQALHRYLPSTTGYQAGVYP